MARSLDVLQGWRGGRTVESISNGEVEAEVEVEVEGSGDASASSVARPSGRGA